MSEEEIPLESETLTVIVELGPMVLLELGCNEIVGDSRSTLPFLHVIGPSLPSRSTLRHANSKVIVVPGLVEGK